ncbi:uncharacterized protein TrAFT101_000134 [Trichoderma asperellum]|nr:hypothetical protein TrAFT101_000134 [Trichoderma asperellum]
MCKEKPEMVDSLLRSTMDFYRQGRIRAISIDEIFPGVKMQEAFQHMQQGSHIGKVVLEFREPTSGDLQLGQIQPGSASTTTVLDGQASYLLVGGLGGLGRSVALFVEEIQSMGCEVHLVRGSVTEATDVARAVAESPRPLKGVIQMAMVLHDQAWRRMTIDEWNMATAPKANDASANTFLDAFVKFRTSKGLPCTSLNIGAVENAGDLVQEEQLLKKLEGTGWRAVQESELLDVLESAIRQSPSPSAQPGSPESSLVNAGQTLVGIVPVVPLSSPDSSAKLRKDVRMSVFRNIRIQAKGGASSDSLRQFLDAAKTSPETLSKPESVGLLTQEIGKKLLGLVLRPVDGEIDASLSLAQLGLDSIVAAEMRAWWKQMFGLDISVLEMLSMGTLEALGKQAAEGLLALHG